MHFCLFNLYINKKNVNVRFSKWLCKYQLSFHWKKCWNVPLNPLIVFHHLDTLLYLSPRFTCTSLLFPRETVCILCSSICQLILSELKGFNFLLYLEAVFSFSDSSPLFSLPKNISFRCERPFGFSHKSNLPQDFYTSLLYIPWEGGAASVLEHVSSGGETGNHSGAVWLSGVIWPCLGFLTTWKDVQRPDGSSPLQADAQKNYIQEISQLHTWDRHVCCAVTLVSSVCCSWCRQAVRADLQTRRLPFLRASSRACQRRDPLRQRQLKWRVCRRTVSGECI